MSALFLRSRAVLVYVLYFSSAKISRYFSVWVERARSITESVKIQISYYCNFCMDAVCVKTVEGSKSLALISKEGSDFTVRFLSGAAVFNEYKLRL